MIMKGRSPTMRHVTRTHRVALDWLFDRINSDPKIQIRFVDILTKGSFSKNEWNNLLRFSNIMNVSTFSRSRFSHCVSDVSKDSKPMPQRGQEQKIGEGSAVAKPKPMSPVQNRTIIPVAQASHASSRWGTSSDSEAILNKRGEQRQ